MSVEVALIGRLGNNLFQYSLGRIIAESLGLRLSCVQIPLPPAHPSRQLHLGPSTLEECAPSFPSAPLIVNGAVRGHPAEFHVMKLGGNWGGQTIDLAGILKNREPRRIRLAGYFQRSEYYLPYRDTIRCWFAPAQAPSLVIPQPNDVLVSIRRGIDYDLKGWTLPLTYYAEAFGRMDNLGRIYVVGTGIDDLVREFFAEYRPIYLGGTPTEHLQALPRFSRFVLSNSTFSWWTAFLSDADEVYAPEAAPGSGLFALQGFQDVDLRLSEGIYRPILVNAPCGPADQRESAHIGG